MLVQISQLEKDAAVHAIYRVKISNKNFHTARALAERWLDGRDKAQFLGMMSVQLNPAAIADVDLSKSEIETLIEVEEASRMSQSLECLFGFALADLAMRAKTVKEEAEAVKAAPAAPVASAAS